MLYICTHMAAVGIKGLNSYIRLHIGSWSRIPQHRHPVGKVNARPVCGDRQTVELATEHRVIDIILLLVLHSCGFKKPVESLFRSKVLSGQMTEVLLESAFKSHGDVSYSVCHNHNSSESDQYLLLWSGWRWADIEFLFSERIWMSRISVQISPDQIFGSCAWLIIQGSHASWKVLDFFL